MRTPVLNQNEALPTTLHGELQGPTRSAQDSKLQTRWSGAWAPSELCHFLLHNGARSPGPHLSQLKGLE